MLNINELIFSNQRHRMARCILNNLMLHCLKDTHICFKDSQTETKGIKKDILSKWVATLIADKIDFKLKMTKRQRRSLHNDKGSIYQEYMTNVNIYVPNIGELKIK